MSTARASTPRSRFGSGRTLRFLRLFRRREETLNEKLLREAGYEADGTKLPDAAPPRVAAEPLLPAVAASPVQPRLGEWDAVTIAVAPGLREPGYDFVTVPDGSLIVGETCDEDLAALADAIEARLQPPYRARAIRQNDRQWLVSGRRIQVVQLAIEGEELELSSLGGQRIFSVDGSPVPAASAPAELAAAGARLGADFTVRASRIVDDLWEIEADPL